MMFGLDDEDEKQQAVSDYLQNAFGGQQAVAEPAPAVSQGLSRDEAIREYLTKKYQDDREQIERSNNIGNFGRAFETFARSNSMAHGGSGVDSSYWEGLKKDPRAAQQADMNLIKLTANPKAAGPQYLQDLHDPNSAASKSLLEARRKAHPKYAHFYNDGLSGYQINQLTKDIMARETQDHQNDMQTKKQEAQVSNINLRRAYKELDSLFKGLDPSLASSTSPVGKAQGRLDGSLRVMGFIHTTPEEIQAAEANPKKRAELVKKWDDLSSQDYAEVVLGLLAQVAPGSPTVSQFEHLRADTLDQTASNVQQWFAKNPAPANMGEFIMKGMSTLNNERRINQEIIRGNQQNAPTRAPSAMTHPATKDQAQQAIQNFMPSSSEFRTPKPAPNGLKRVNQGGVIYVWDGFDYVKGN